MRSEHSTWRRMARIARWRQDVLVAQSTELGFAYGWIRCVLWAYRYIADRLFRGHGLHNCGWIPDARSTTAAAGPTGMPTSWGSRSSAASSASSASTPPGRSRRSDLFEKRRDSWPLGGRTSQNPETKRPDDNSRTRETLQSARNVPITPRSLSTRSSSCRMAV